jgi:hypothetical protein
MRKRNIVDWLPGKSLSLSVPPRLLTGENAPRYRSPTNHGEPIPKLVTGMELLVRKLADGGRLGYVS